MKLFVITAIFCIVPFSASFAEIIPPKAAWKSPVSLSHGKSVKKRAKTIIGYSELSDEKSLCRALELPANDFFAEDSPDAFDTFELKIPDYNLPESDIPLTVNSKVEGFIDFFQTSGRSGFAKWLSRSERYLPMMKEVLRKNSLPEDLVYLAMIESGFSPRAYSRASAVGPWQFVAGTGKRYSLRIDEWIDERRDPLKSTIAAAMYLKDLYGLFNNDWYLAAAGYNAGENKILRAIDRYNSTDFWDIAEGSYLKRETKNYVPKLLAAAIIAKEPAKYGFADVAYLPPLEFDTVVIESRTDLDLVADLIGVSYETMRRLNPELKRWCTPPDYPDYELKLPKGKKELFLNAFHGIPPEKRFAERIFTRYRAKRGETIASIARRFGIDPEEIATLNSLKNPKRLRGKVVVIPVRVDDCDSLAVRTASSPKEKKPVKKSVRYYTIKRGDTLSALARRFNVTINVIAAWNNLDPEDILRPGKKIIVTKSVETSSS